MRTEILGKLNEIFKDVFDGEHINITEETTNNDIEDWDSLEHINLIVAIEKTFGIRFSMDEVNEMDSVRMIIDIILRHDVIIH